MAKPATRDGYTDQYTMDCERVLVTLLRGLGPWKDSVFLIGGLTPRYLVPAEIPNVPPHAGTLDVDIVVDLQILTDVHAYHTLEENLRKMGFTRAENDLGQKLSWRWKTHTEQGALMVLELLCDAPDIAGGKVHPLPTDRGISALNVPNSSIVFDMYQVAEITAELLDGNGIATERVKHADMVSFTCLKAFAFDQRFERKDAHDMIHCLEHAPQGLDAVANSFRGKLGGKHGGVMQKSLGILRNRFAGEDQVEGYLKDGPVAVAKFEVVDGNEPHQREARLRRQRDVNDVVEDLLEKVGC